MTEPHQPTRSYALSDGVRILRSEMEIRFRRGIWNYNEALVRLTDQPERVRRFFNEVHMELVHGRIADTDAIAQNIGLNTEETNSFGRVLEDLKRQRFLCTPEQRKVTHVVSALLGGNLGGFGEYANAPRPVLFLADNSYVRDTAKSLAKEVGLPLDVLDDETLRRLATVDLTSRIDAVQHAAGASELGVLFTRYACVMGCIADPNLSILRNLNRLLVHAEKPLILGMIDGPFMSLLATLATESGCFECFEQRMLARMEDTAVYHRFAEATMSSQTRRSSFAPSLHLLTAAVIGEGYLYSTLSVLRLAGRIVNIYLPLLEIQVQDLLRVPYCPACGFISKAQMNEMYTSSRSIVSEMLAKVEVKG